MQAKVYWVPGPWRGKLGIVPRPRGGDWLQDETAAWRRAGIDWIVSLLEPEEESQLRLQSEAAAATANSIVVKPFPIPDGAVPASRESVAELADEIVKALETGKNVAVHCREGIGRSPLIVGSVLVAAGEDPATAFNVVGEARGLTVPETEEQRRWLRDFAAWLPSTRAVRHAAVNRRDRNGPRSKRS